VTNAYVRARAMANNNLGFSTMATGQLERMIDDAAWLTYPLDSSDSIWSRYVQN
jgi:putative AlgH/UPF0301 family transcriptional regulator